ncbi:hypothetical protein [Rhodoferax ferrireducens]|uniref:hypothetical protein n=1 Tax=Rhodoferax ferrireducens TaxID=192843 RepID=UPI000E0D8D7A|nr:hypothetical protein [Rhodoferax ferrireducens]
MNDHHTRVITTREEAHAAITQAYIVAKTLLMDGKRVRISVGEDSDPITIKQRRFLHGPVLTQIAEQVRVGGQRYTTGIWKRFFKNLILERKPRYEMIRMPGAKRATPRRKWWGTEELSIKQYSQFIDEVIAHAVTEFSVSFHFLAGEREAVRYVRPVAKRRVDQETGEILEHA